MLMVNGVKNKRGGEDEVTIYLRQGVSPPKAGSRMGRYKDRLSNSVQTSLKVFVYTSHVGDG